MHSISSDEAMVSVGRDGRVVIPAEIARAAGLVPGARLVLEVSDAEVFVRSQALAEAEDADDAASVERILSDPEDAQTVAWEDVKHKLEP